MRASSTVRANFAGMSAKPGAKTVITCGMKISPSAVNVPSQKTITAKASRAKSCAAAGPSAVSRPENSGTKAALKAPSPNRRRNRLGSLLATKNASATGPVPSSAAINMSRNRPRTRLAMVQTPTVNTPRSMAPPYRRSARRTTPAGALRGNKPGLCPGPRQGALPFGSPPRAAALGTRPFSCGAGGDARAGEACAAVGHPARSRQMTDDSARLPGSGIPSRTTD